MLTVLVPAGSLESDSAIPLHGEQGHHLRVRRATPDETIRLIDGCGMVAEGHLVRAEDGFVAHPLRGQRMPPPPALTLAVGAGDRDRFGWLVEKAAELEVTEVIPLETELSSSVATRVRPQHIERFRKKAREALKQCGGAWAPTVTDPTPLQTFAAQPRAGKRWRADAGGSALPPALGVSDPVTIVIGPEGGLTREETTRLSEAGFQAVRFASRTLRFETAGIAAAAVVAVLRSSSVR